MKRAFLTGLLIAVSPPSLAKPPPSPSTVPDSVRNAAGGRDVLLTLPAKPGLDTSVVKYDLRSNGGGGALGALLIMSMDDRQARLTAPQMVRAKELAATIEATIAGFDFETLARRTTAAGLANSGWLSVRTITLSHEVEGAAVERFAKAATTSQFATIRYDLALSPDFTQLRVVAEFGLYAGDTRPVPVYRESVMSAVQLRDRSFDPAENAKRWAEGDGQRAKTALSLAFGRIEKLTATMLKMDKGTVTRLMSKQQEQVSAGGFAGPLLERDGDNRDGLTLWTGRLIHVQSIP